MIFKKKYVLKVRNIQYSHIYTRHV